MCVEPSGMGPFASNLVSVAQPNEDGTRPFA